MFCENCGKELNENALFCAGCGAAVGAAAGSNNAGFTNGPGSNNAGEYNNQFMGSQQGTVFGNASDLSPSKNVIDKFSRFFGIALMVVAFIDYYSDPPALTILLSISIIAGAIYCLAQKYKLKGFTIFALMIAVFCLLAGLKQGSRYGYFKIPTYENSQSVQSASGYSSDSSYDADNNSSATGSNDISPEFKKQVDDLEKFYNDYCDFMEEYAKAAAKGDVLSMMDKYTKFLSDYTKYEAELEKLNNNQSSMTQAEMNYFLDAYNRIMKRLANVAYSVK